MEDMIGKTFSHYKIIEKIGEGGMGVVYKARDTKLKRTVALKFLPSDLTRATKAKERFIHEAQTASAMDHVNICNIYEINETDDSRLFIAMAYYEGEALNDIIYEKKFTNDKSHIDQVINIILQIADGLSKAHENGIIHRDIKPENIIVRIDGVVKILDFGLAKLTGQTLLTREGSTFGTIAYMSPEQTKGDPVDHRTDIWSLGVILYEMLTGKLPYRGEYPEAVIYSILNETHIKPSELNKKISKDLDNIINNCLYKEPELRFQSVGELIEALETISKGNKPVLIKRKLRRKKKTNRKKKYWYYTSLIAVLIFISLYFTDGPYKIISNILGDSKKNTSEKVQPNNMIKRLVILPFTNVSGGEYNHVFLLGLEKYLWRKLGLLYQDNNNFYIIHPSTIEENPIVHYVNARKLVNSNIALTARLRSLGKEPGEIVRFSANIEQSHGNYFDVVSQDFNESFSNLFIWQDSILFWAADIMKLNISEHSRKLIHAGNTSVPEAFENYLLGIGYRHPNINNYQMAMKAFNQAIELDSSYAMPYLRLAICYRNIGKNDQNYNKALELCNQALKLDSNLVEAYNVLGDINMKFNKPTLALDFYNKGIELDPINLWAYFEKIDYYFRKNNIDTAEMLMTKLLSIRPQSYTINIQIGDYYRTSGQLDKAIKQFEKVADLFPNEYWSYSNLAACYFELLQYDKAEEFLQKSIDIEPNNNAYSNLGVIYYFNDRYADAVEMLEKAMKCKDSDYRIIGNLADAYYLMPGMKTKAMEYYKKAEKDAEKTLKLYRNNTEAELSIAAYNVRLGNTKKARNIVRKIEQDKPENNAELFMIGDIYWHLGNRDKGFEYIQKAIRNGYPLHYIKNNPGLKELRTDERYIKLIEEIEGKS